MRLLLAILVSIAATVRKPSYIGHAILSPLKFTSWLGPPDSGTGPALV